MNMWVLRAFRRQTARLFRRRSSARRVLILCIDTIRHKNLLQLEVLRESLWDCSIVTTDRTGTSARLTESLPNVRLRVTRRHRVRIDLLRMTWAGLWHDAPSVIEVYPGGMMTLLCALLAWCSGVPLLVVARGVEWDYFVGNMTRAARLWLKWTYLLADGVVYKETYMEDLLSGWRVPRQWLIPNAVELGPERILRTDGSCNLVFLNSMKPFRHPERALEGFLELCAERQWSSGASVHLWIVGLAGHPDCIEKEGKVQDMLKGRNVPVSLHTWSNEPYSWLEQADVFLLPADLVWINYALLEAMARGTVPIVQQAPRAADIVTDGVDGLIVGVHPAEWKAAMAKLIDDAPLRERLGAKAREKIQSSFSRASYREAYLRMYSELTATVAERALFHD